MVSDTARHPSSPRRRRPAAIIVFVCCALALAFIPVAAARPGNSRPAGGTGVPNPPGRPSPAAASPGPGNNGQPGPGHKDSPGPGSDEGSQPGHVEYPGLEHGGGQPTPGREEHERPEHRGEHGSGHIGPAGLHPQQGAPGQRPESAGHPATSRGPTISPVPHHASGTAGATRSIPRSATSAAPGKAPAAPPTPARAPIPTLSRAATPIAAPAATTPAPATSTPAATTPQLVGASRPALTGRSPHAARDPRHARNRGARRHTAPVAFSPGAVAPVAAIPFTPVLSARTRRAQRAAHGPPTPSRRPSPIVTTITRIVGVIPTLVWILIGVLSALALALAVRSRLAALRARRLERQRGELLEDVGLLQAALLPLPPARLGPVGTSAAYRPADGPGAGGDFYDVFALEDGQLAVIVGDVSGHGREALPHTALVRFTLRAYLEAGLSPRAAVQTAGDVLERQLGGSFVTVVAATYQPRERILTYACAGHPPPVVLGSRSIAPITVCSPPPIGAGMRTGTRQTVVSVPGRSQVCFHTDGVTEARVAGELFGAERLARTLAELGPQATASALLDQVAEETDARPDDMAACLLNVEGGAAAPTILVEELELDREEAAGDRIERFLLACGVQRREVAELMRSARVVAERAGTVVVELRLLDGPPEVALGRDNVALLHTSHVRRQTDFRVSR